MTFKEIYKMVSVGRHPLMRCYVDMSAHETIFDQHMVGRIVNISIEDSGTPDEHFKVSIEEESFRGVNSPYMLKDYYDNSGVARLNYIESGNAPKNGIEHYHFMPNDDFFEIIENGGVFQRYIDSKSILSYTSWLEKIVSEIENK